MVYPIRLQPFTTLVCPAWQHASGRDKDSVANRSREKKELLSKAGEWIVVAKGSLEGVS